MSLGRAALAMAFVWTGCDAQISDGLGSSSIGVDAQPGGGSGSGVGSGSDLPTDPAARCAARVLYLNFEGQALTRSATSDATRGYASWLQNATGTATPYHSGDADRATQIQVIVDGVRTALSQFPVTVTTARPASGDYVMVVLGGQRQVVGSRFGAAVNTLDCGDLVKDDVAWIADNVAPAQHVINLVIGAVGFGLGLTATRDPDDCLCGWDNDCQSNNNTACRLGAPITRDPAANQLCGGAGATQNEVTALHDAFCGK